MLSAPDAPRRSLPHDLPPWEAVYQQSQRWIAAKVFEAIVHDLRALFAWRRASQINLPQRSLMVARCNLLPKAENVPGTTDKKKRKGSKIHLAVYTLGYLLALHVTPANDQERAQVQVLAEKVQDVTGNSVEIAYVDQGYTGENAEQAAKQAGIELMVVKLPEAKKGVVLIPRRWVVERSFAWTARFRSLARDFERTPETLAGLHFLALLMLMLPKFVASIAHLL